MKQNVVSLIQLIKTIWKSSGALQNTRSIFIFYLRLRLKNFQKQI